MVIDPTHGLYVGDQYPRRGSVIAPIFTDTAPDPWGRSWQDVAASVSLGEVELDTLANAIQA